MEKTELGCDRVIVLAGGDSERLGTPKGLVRRESQTWLEHQLSHLERAGLRHAVLVLGRHAEAYQSALPKLVHLAAPDTAPVVGRIGALSLHISINPEPERGPFSSLRIGLGKISMQQTDLHTGCFVLPIDVPCPAPEVWQVLAELGHTPEIRASVPTHGHRGGHPVWLSREFIESLAALPADDRLDLRLRALPAGQLKRIEVMDPSIRMNLNTPQDWPSDWNDLFDHES